jgi:hypothetical protein
MSNDTQSPGPNPRPNPAELEVHPGGVRSGVDNKLGHKAYYINLEAKPGKGDKVEQFLRDILAGVEQEPGTGPGLGAGSPTQPSEFLRHFPTLRRETRMTSVQAAVTSFGQQTWMRCWLIPHISIGSTPHLENSASCSERKSLRRRRVEMQSAPVQTVAL